MSRFFTLSEAERLLPEVERALEDARALYRTHQEAESKLERYLEHKQMMGGTLMDRGYVVSLREQRNETATKVNQAVERIQHLGCQVKDLDTGLVDFPTQYRGNTVLLCWRLGEQAIRFWHGQEEGFRGRKEIDKDFLEHHRGDLLH